MEALSSCNHAKLRILNAIVLIANTPPSLNLTRHGSTKLKFKLFIYYYFSFNVLLLRARLVLMQRTCLFSFSFFIGCAQTKSNNFCFFVDKCV